VLQITANSGQTQDLECPLSKVCIVLLESSVVAAAGGGAIYLPSIGSQVSVVVDFRGHYHSFPEKSSS